VDDVPTPLIKPAVVPSTTVHRNGMTLQFKYNASVSSPLNGVDLTPTNDGANDECVFFDVFNAVSGVQQPVTSVCPATGWQN
jgi:hypothetical protein